VFCNYILDVLPATVLCKGLDEPEELCIRTHLIEDRAILAQYTRLTPDEIREMARSENPEEKARLAPLMSLLEFETAFMPVRQESALAAEALADWKAMMAFLVAPP
jgi:hypothetical protein